MKVAVVGAGWAGLAAALRLADLGAQVTLFEAAPIAGGRARSASIGTSLGRFTLDNGQHLMLGAYRDTLALMQDLGAGERLQRSRLALASASGVSLRAAALPAPLHLAWATLTARGLGPGGRRSLIRLILGLQGAGWRTPPGESVATLLARHGQPPMLVRRLWEPLCIGALNTRPSAACAAAFAAVLRDSLGAARSASDFVTSDAPLGELLPQPALARLAALGASVRLRAPVRRLVREATGWRAITLREAPGTSVAHDALLLALPPWAAAGLLEASGIRCEPLRAFEPEPIATAWAFWRPGECPELPRWSLLDEDAARGRHGQWFFDRGVRHADDATVASSQARTVGAARVGGIVISVASRIAELTAAEVCEGVAAQLQQAFAGAPPAAMRLLIERRATFRCTPQRPRLTPDHLHAQAPGLWLAGDWLWPDYPATLEAAVRSGEAAADAILAG